MSKKQEEPGNQTPNTPDISETQLAQMKVDELRNMARDMNISGASDMRKPELVHAVAEASSSGTTDSTGGGVRTGPESSKSLKYAQEITSPDEEPERPGRSLVTTDHDVIQHWAEERGAQPAAVPGTEHEGSLGVLRFDFPDYGGDDLRHVSWEDWFDTFDSRRLNFIYQEQRSDGNTSNFFRLESPTREDA